jgi:hypothetical protein
LREEYVKKVAKGDPYALDELKKLINHRDRFQGNYNRYTLPEQDPEYQVYINILGEIYNTKIRKVIENFTEYEKAFNDRERVYHHYMSEQNSESLQTFKEELL